MKKIDNIAGILVYTGLAGVVVSLVVVLVVVIVWSLIFGV